MQTKRSRILMIASFLLVLSAPLFWGVVLLSINEGDPGLAMVVFVGVILGVLSLVAAAGVFVVKRWGRGLAVVVSVFAMFCALSGSVLSDPSLKKGLCVVLTALYVLVVVLMALPSTRQFYVRGPALTGEKAN